MAYESRKTKSHEHWLQMKKEALAKHAEGKYLTLEEIAVAIWNPMTEEHPMTCMGVLKVLNKALEKLKKALKKYGINDLSDVFEPKYREFGKPTALDPSSLCKTPSIY